MKTEYLVMLSEIIDKMEIADELKSLEINTGNTKKDNEELGKKVIMMIFTKIYKCKTEFYSFIATYKGYLKDEEDYENDEAYTIARKEAIKQAKGEDIIAILKEIAKLPGVADFLATA